MRILKGLIGVACVGWLMATLVSGQKPAAPATGQKISAGNGTLYIGTYQKRIEILDEATERVVGSIPLKTGIARRLELSLDRRKFYATDVSYENIEVVDIASRTVVDSFKLSEGDKLVRIYSHQVDPLGRFLIVLTKTTMRLKDRFEVGPPTLLQVDLKTHAVMRTIPWPKGEEREFVNILISPDGKLLYFFSDDVLIYDTTDFRQVDKWELSRPIEDGFGRIDFNATDVMNDEPGFFTGLFTVEDPVQKRRIFGVGRVNLSAKSVDFYTLGPATRLTFTLAPDRKRAYGLLRDIGHYEFWTFDLENRRIHSRTEFPGRPRMALKTSSNGKVLYIYQAGNTIDLHDAATYKYLRTITLDGDMATDLFVMPSSGSRQTSSGQ